MKGQTQKNFSKIIKTEKFDKTILEIESNSIFEDILDECIDLCYGKGIEKENVEYLNSEGVWKLKLEGENLNHRVFFEFEDKGATCILLWVEKRDEDTYPIEDNQMRDAKKKSSNEDLRELK